MLVYQRVTSFLIPLLWASFPRHIVHYLRGPFLGKKSPDQIRWFTSQPIAALLGNVVIRHPWLYYVQALFVAYVCYTVKTLIYDAQEPFVQSLSQWISWCALAIFLYSVLYHHVSFVSLLVSFKIGSGRNSCFARGCKNYSRWVVPSSGSEFLWFHQEKIGQSADQACQSTDLKISHADLVQKSTFPWVSLLFLYSWWLWWWKATMDDHFPRVKALPLQPPCAVVIWSSSHIPTSFFCGIGAKSTSWWGG